MHIPFIAKLVVEHEERRKELSVLILLDTCGS